MTNISIGNIPLGEKVICVSPLTDIDVYSIESVEGVDIIELRIDMFSDISEKGTSDTFTVARDKFNLPIIATCRSHREGGAVDINDNLRLKLFKSVIDLSDAIDIEIRSKISKDVISFAKDHNKTTIASYHDFKQTPNLSTLEDIDKMGRDQNSDIVKIAVTPINYNDLRTLTEFTLKYHNKGIVTIAMGELGRTSRLFLPLIGSLFTFASIKTISAPGQLTIRELRQFFPAVVKTCKDL
ncbi:MAG: type I 3-dehydroquinate dehydratase [Nitrospirae bacterium]|nr:type I 3-dehydroquinate dehydratase [Nitrospirota bacterium]